MEDEQKIKVGEAEITQEELKKAVIRDMDACIAFLNVCRETPGVMDLISAQLAKIHLSNGPLIDQYKEEFEKAKQPTHG